ncbi:MAG: YbaN family protein [Flavobacteriales bacterium]
MSVLEFFSLITRNTFLLLAAYFFCSSSPKHYEMLMQHKQLGPYIAHFREKKGIQLKAKMASILFIWISVSYSTFIRSVCFGYKLLYGSWLSVQISSSLAINFEEINQILYLSLEQPF